MACAAALVACLETHKEGARVALWGLQAVSSLLHSSGGHLSLHEKQRKLAEAGACQAVVAAVKEHPMDLQVQWHGARAIAWLVWLCHSNCARLGAEGACEVFTSLLRSVGADLSDRRAVSFLKVVSVLAELPDNSERLAAAGVCETLVAMLQHPSDDLPTSLQDQIEITQCNVAQTITAMAKHSAARLGAAGACQALVRVINTSLERTDMQLSAFQAVLALAQLPDNRERLIAVDVFAALNRSTTQWGYFREDLRATAAAILQLDLHQGH
eukprot:TRINITY_DN5894_c0_g1_i1.p1 TRINITY_DN5894_c0_g1~~TRINITY_DN5894_c0_g1_i1.p1  ORF type:complete len:270 (-),score=22.50 TRINITY_DN5894_c0_g1_i1:56-865(-)